MVKKIDIMSYDTFGEKDILGADYWTSKMSDLGRSKVYSPMAHIDFKDELDYNNAVAYLMDVKGADLERGVTFYVEN